MAVSEAHLGFLWLKWRFCCWLLAAAAAVAIVVVASAAAAATAVACRCRLPLPPAYQTFSNGGKRVDVLVRPCSYLSIPICGIVVDIRSYIGRHIPCWVAAAANTLHLTDARAFAILCIVKLDAFRGGLHGSPGRRRRFAGFGHIILL